MVYLVQHNGSGELVDKSGHLECDKRFGSAVEFVDYTKASMFVHDTLDGVVCDEIEKEIDDALYVGYSVIVP